MAGARGSQLGPERQQPTPDRLPPPCSGRLPNEPFPGPLIRPLISSPFEGPSHAPPAGLITQTPSGPGSPELGAVGLSSRSGSRGHCRWCSGRDVAGQPARGHLSPSQAPCWGEGAVEGRSPHHMSRGQAQKDNGSKSVAPAVGGGPDCPLCLGADGVHCPPPSPPLSPQQPGRSGATGYTGLRGPSTRTSRCHTRPWWRRRGAACGVQKAASGSAGLRGAPSCRRPAPQSRPSLPRSHTRAHTLRRETRPPAPALAAGLGFY